MRSKASLLLLLGLLMAENAAAESVILLHGLARTGKSMGKIENTLSRQGYCVTNVSYDSRNGNIETLASEVAFRGSVSALPCPNVAIDDL